MDIASLLKFLCVVPFLAPVAEVGVLFALSYALGRLGVQVTRDHVILAGPDAWSMMGCLFGGALISTAMAAVLGIVPGLTAATVSLLAAAAGCRLELVVGRDGVTLYRRVFGVLAWRVRHSSSAPSLFVDGWGDMMDPEALHIDLGSSSLEIAWGSARSGDRADALAVEFNRAVRCLREQALG